MSPVPKPTPDDVAIECARGLAATPLDGARVLVLIPDATRTCPLDVVFPILHAQLAPRAAAITVMVALGTHRPMAEPDVLAMLGVADGDRAEAERRYPGVRVLNHAWDEPGALTEVGTFTRAEVEAVSDGRLSLDVPIEINRAVLDHDVLLVLGPVFPHEVAGFSGGNKYAFPGISGPRMIHFFHWLGALLTNRAIIGVERTPVRDVIDRAAARLPIERAAVCLVVEPSDGSLVGVFAGRVEEAWSRAAALSARVHVVWHDRPFHTVLSCAPRMYADLWTAGKCMYKLEPAIADGGTLIVHAPHVTQVSAVHGHVLERIGYHVRDYFLEQWDRFRDEPWGVLAHSTHVKGDGTFTGGVEQPRVHVELATGIDEPTCRRIDLGYRDWRQIDVETFAAREDEGVLLVRKAGERLHRLRGDSTVPD